MSQQAAKRRRRQFSIKFRRKLEQRIAVERAIQSRGKKR